MEVTEIRRLQMFLALAGFYGGEIDGVEGPETKAAVLEAYEAIGLVESPLAGFKAGPIDRPETKAAVLEAYDVIAHHVLSPQDLVARLMPFLGGLGGQTYAEAWRAVVKHAEGMGIAPGQIDQGYVWAVWRNKVADWQARYMPEK